MKTGGAVWSLPNLPNLNCLTFDLAMVSPKCFHESTWVIGPISDTSESGMTSFSKRKSAADSLTVRATIDKKSRLGIRSNFVTAVRGIHSLTSADYVDIDVYISLLRCRYLKRAPLRHQQRKLITNSTTMRSNEPVSSFLQSCADSSVSNSA